jgi:hypothetical protein
MRVSRTRKNFSANICIASIKKKIATPICLGGLLQIQSIKGRFGINRTVEASWPKTTKARLVTTGLLKAVTPAQANAKASKPEPRSTSPAAMSARKPPETRS